VVSGIARSVAAPWHGSFGLSVQALSPTRVVRSRAAERRRGGVSGSVLPAGLELCGALADAVLVCDRMPTRPAALTVSANPAGCFQVSKEPEKLLAVRAGLFG
jgi:hypothetical protein